MLRPKTEALEYPDFEEMTIELRGSRWHLVPPKGKRPIISIPVWTLSRSGKVEGEQDTQEAAKAILSVAYRSYCNAANLQFARGQRKAMNQMRVALGMQRL